MINVKIYMASIHTTVPNLNISITVENVTFIPNVTKVELIGSQLNCYVHDGLLDDTYKDISKQLRIIYSLSFEHVYSEDYDVNKPENSITVFGHNERKQHLLNETYTQLNENFSSTSQQIFRDILELDTSLPRRTKFLNMAYIWSRANEMVELKLLTEAFTQFWRVLDVMHAKTSTSEAKIKLQQHGLSETTHNIFAARALITISNGQRMSGPGAVLSIASLDALRQPHAHQAGGRRKYYLEEETHLEAEIYNWFISDVTKVFVLWLIGLDDYYLSPRANIYEIKKHGI